MPKWGFEASETSTANQEACSRKKLIGTDNWVQQKAQIPKVVCKLPNAFKGKNWAKIEIWAHGQTKSMGNGSNYTDRASKLAQKWEIWAKNVLKCLKSPKMRQKRDWSSWRAMQTKLLGIGSKWSSGDSKSTKTLQIGSKMRKSS